MNLRSSLCLSPHNTWTESVQMISYSEKIHFWKLNYEAMKQMSSYSETTHFKKLNYGIVYNHLQWKGNQICNQLQRPPNQCCLQSSHLQKPHLQNTEQQVVFIFIFSLIHELGHSLYLLDLDFWWYPIFLQAQLIQCASLCRLIFSIFWKLFCPTLNS